MARTKATKRSWMQTQKRMRQKRPIAPGPRTILNTDKVNIHTAHIEHANRVNSPLLRLPAEIRNRIFEYVFDVGILHVGTKEARYERTLPKTICCATEHDDDVTQAIRNSTAYDKDDLFKERHDQCLWSDERTDFWRLLDLLRTSRQIHSETALLPYQLNTFSFTTLVFFAKFKKLLSPDQLKTVQSIGFYMDYHYVWGPNRLKTHYQRGEELPQLHDMCGVRNLSVFLDVDIYLYEDPEVLGIEILAHIKKADLDLNKVSITIYPCHNDEDFPGWFADSKEWSA